MLGTKPRLRKSDSSVASQVTSKTSPKMRAGNNSDICLSNVKTKEHEIRRRTKLERHSTPGRNHYLQPMKNEKVESIDLKKIENAINIDELFVPKKEFCFSKYKGVILKHTTAKKLQQVLSGKVKPLPKERLSKCRNKDFIQDSEGKLYRRFIMEGPVQFTVGMQSQERYLFLYSDLLIVSKIRSYSVYKLKHCIRLCEMWFGDNIEDVCEATLCPRSSFVLGWPITNVVATFCSPEMKQLWLSKLKQLSKEARSKEPTNTTIPVICTSWNSSRKCCKHINVCSNDTTKQCIRNILQQIGAKNEDLYQYQLWVKTVNEESPYPLIGHERPYAIKVSCLRQKQHLKEKSYNNVCVFILRNIKEIKINLEGISSVQKKEKISRKTHIVNKVFRRSSSKPDLLDLNDTLSTFPPGLLFGHPLSTLYCNNTLPQPIMDILTQLVLKGPFTHGIFRKSANLKACQDLRNKLDGYQDCHLETINIVILAAVFKDFLRSLPNCLFLCELYDDWLDASMSSVLNVKLRKIVKLLEKLPRANLCLLKHFLCVLWHIAQRSAENQMNASNLAVCIGPSLLWSIKPVLQPENSKKIPLLVEFLIDKASLIFGKEVLNLFGNRGQKDVSRQDSGAEESDSIHSSTSGIRQDDSSLDSLEHLLHGDAENSPKFPNHNKLSLTNLSRDSGLTMSDSQLYTPDEDEEEQAKTKEFGDNVDFNADKCKPSLYHSSFEENVQKPPVCERTVSVCELSNGYNKQTLIRSKSAHLTTLNYIDVENSPDSSDTKAETEKFSNFYPFFKKEPHKKRLSQARRWYNPRTPWDPDDISPPSTLRKSISEESILNEKQKSSGIIGIHNQSHSKITSVNFNKILNTDDSVLSGLVYRSKSLHQLPSSDDLTHMITPSFSNCALNDEVIWHRTQSTPQLNDASYDSSTVSDDDSTPHVSRSNSRGKEYVLYDDCSLMCAQKQLNHNSHLYDDEFGFSSNSKHDNPPSYEETINRQTFLRQSSPCNNKILDSFNGEPLYVNVPLRHLQNKLLCFSADDVPYAEGELHFAIPVHIGGNDDTDPPPLPPKPKNLQKINISSIIPSKMNHNCKSNKSISGNCNKPRNVSSEQYSQTKFLHKASNSEAITNPKEAKHFLEGSPSSKVAISELNVGSFSNSGKFQYSNKIEEKRISHLSHNYKNIRSVFTTYNEESYV